VARRAAAADRAARPHHFFAFSFELNLFSHTWSVVMRSWIRSVAVLGSASLVAGLLSVVLVAAPASAGTSDADCPFADSIGAECVISSAWTVGAGGVAANNFPDPPGLPGPFVFNKPLHIVAGGSINASDAGGPGITIQVNGGFTMDAGASLVDTGDIGGNGQAAGPLKITATGAGNLGAGSQVLAQNTFGNGGGGAIELSFGASSTFAGTISSEELSTVDQTPAGDIKITVTGNLVLAPTAVISSQKHSDSSASGKIDVTVSGDMTMQGPGPGAVITSAHPGATNGTPGGNITIKVGSGNSGVFSMQDGTLIDSGGSGAAGNIAITAGDKILQAALAKILAGQFAQQTSRGHGGRIFLISGCKTEILGVVSSQGHDPGADLVHIEGCEVHLGPVSLVESTGPAHEPGYPNSCDGIDDNAGVDDGEVFRPDHPDFSTTCVEIWGRHITIDAGAEVNADFAQGGGIQGHGWIDIFAETDITLNGPVAGSAKYAVHTNSGLGNDVGGDIRVVAKNSFVTFTGQVLQANATTNGGSGGTILVEGGGNVSFGSSLSEALGSQGAFADHAEIGGTINGRSYAGGLSGVAPGKLDTDAFDTNGTVTLQSCLGTSYTGFTQPGALTILGNLCAPATPPIPAYVVFNPGQRWDACGGITINGHKYLNGTNPLQGLPGWTIHLYGPDPTQQFNQPPVSVLTGAGGEYSFGNLAPGVYKICEVFPDNSWLQDQPGPGVPCTGTGEGPNGFLVDTGQFTNTCCSGLPIGPRDFYNHQRPPDIECPEDPNRADEITRTVDAGKPLGGTPPNYATVQAAYNAAKVSAAPETIGMYMKTKENVLLDTYAGPSMTLTQCTSAQITALDSTKPVWKLTSTKKLLIIGPDSVGGTIGWEICFGTHELKSIRSNGATQYGVKILSNGNKVSFNNVASSGVGIGVFGNANELKSGTIGPNTGAGIHITSGKTGNTVTGMTIQNNGNNGVLVDGGSNSIKSNKLKANSPNGVKTTGAGNTVESNESSENNGDGYNIGGSSTTFKNNKGKKNTGDGVELSGSGQKPTGDAPESNTGVAWRIVGTPATVVSSPSSNKANGSSIPSATKCPGYFTNAGGATCNP
jgi:hypothetical protein